MSSIDRSAEVDRRNFLKKAAFGVSGLALRDQLVSNSKAIPMREFTAGADNNLKVWLDGERIEDRAYRAYMPEAAGVEANGWVCVRPRPLTIENRHDTETLHGRVRWEPMR